MQTVSSYGVELRKQNIPIRQTLEIYRSAVSYLIGIYVQVWEELAENGGCCMPKVMQDLIEQYIEAVKKIYGSHVRQIILYGSYARGDFRSDLDVDIMILLDLSDLELKAYGQQLSYMTYDFNMDHDLDIKPIAKSEAHFNKWIVNYPFYANIHREGVVLYGAASAVENAVEVQVAIISKH